MILPVIELNISFILIGYIDIYGTSHDVYIAILALLQSFNLYLFYDGKSLQNLDLLHLFYLKAHISNYVA